MSNKIHAQINNFAGALCDRNFLGVNFLEFLTTAESERCATCTRLLKKRGYALSARRKSLRAPILILK